MSSELIDARLKVTVETDCVLEAEHRVTGDDKSVIARKILHEWALQKMRTAKITDALLRSKGEPGIADGIAGNSGALRGKGSK